MSKRSCYIADVSIEAVERYKQALAGAETDMETLGKAIRADLDCSDWSVDKDLIAEFKEAYNKAAQLRRCLSYCEKKRKIKLQSLKDRVS